MTWPNPPTAPSLAPSVRAGLLVILTALASVNAADLKVYSEFRRIGPDGEIVPADRGGAVREILSPRALRGGWTSFQLVVEGDPGTEFWIYLGQNPDNAGAFKIYRVSHTAGLPDKLESVEEPVHGEIPAGQKAAVFWLDLRYPGEGPAGRVKLEPQLFLPAEKRWIIYPMEVNVTPARARTVIEKVGSRQPPVATARADAPAMAVLRAFRCPGVTLPAATNEPKSVLGLIERNARQDVSLLRRLSPQALAELLPPTFCTAELPPEGLLRMRDRLYKLLEKEP